MVAFWAPQNEDSIGAVSTLEKIASNKEGKVKLVKIDTYRNQRVAQRYDVKIIPSVLFFQNGQLLDRISGVFNEIDIIEKIANVFSET